MTARDWRDREQIHPSRHLEYLFQTLDPDEFLCHFGLKETIALRTIDSFWGMIMPPNPFSCPNSLETSVLDA